MRFTVIRFRPLYDRLLVRRSAEATTTTGGIHIPMSGQERPPEGEVIAVGAGRLMENGAVRPLDVMVGDRVMFDRDGGVEIKVAGEVFFMLSERDVLGVIG
jgi:chaperonin GroES